MAIVFRIRGRRVRGDRKHHGKLRPVKAVASPDRAWLAVVLSGPPFESGVESIVETGLWMFFWLLPLRLSRIEVWVVPAPAGPGGRPIEERLAEGPPAARRVIWRGEGGPRRAEDVEVAWTGPRSIRASFRGVVHEIEVPAGW
jgi:hypothetical protein